jgi:hypothetical protein
MTYCDEDLAAPDKLQFDEKLLNTWNTYMQAGYFR